MGLKSKPAAIKVQPGHLTEECVGCEVEWHKDGNPFDKKDAYLVTWDDQSVTIKLKGKSKKHKVPYEHVILRYIQMERGWIFDGGSKMAVTPEMRDPYYLTHIDEPEVVSDNSQQQDQENQKEETPTKESSPQESDQQKKSSQTTQKKEKTPKKSQQQSKSKTTDTSKQSSSKKTSSTKKSTTRKQKGDANAFVAKKNSSKKPSLKSNLV